MGVKFTVGHLGAGTEEFDLPSEEVDSVLDSLLKELHTSDDEHYQLYVINATGTSVTTFDSGLMQLSAGMGETGPENRYYRPATQAEAVGVLNAFVHVRREMFLPLFVLEKPAPGPGPNFVIDGMGPFALHTAAASGNFTRVQSLVEAGRNVNLRDASGVTPLVLAVMEGAAEICRYLIEHGADVTVRLPGGWGSDERSLLQQAVKQGRFRGSAEIVEMLRQAGAKE